MMSKILLSIIFFILIYPSISDAAYNVYLKNGKVLSGVSSYEKQGGEVIIYFIGGSIGISEKDILRIEETGGPERDFSSKDTTSRQEEIAAPPKGQVSGRADTIRAELEALYREVKRLEEEEAGIAASMNEKAGRRHKYNRYQLIQLEKELEPLQQELSAVQQQKAGLLQKKTSLESELNTLK